MSAGREKPDGLCQNAAITGQRTGLRTGVLLDLFLEGRNTGRELEEDLC